MTIENQLSRLEFLEYTGFHADIENKLKLQLNPKTKIRKLSQNITWLGFTFRINEDCSIICKVTRKSIKRYPKRLKKYKKLYDANELEFDNIASSINSVKSHIMKSGKPKKTIKYLDKKVKEILGKKFYKEYKKKYRDPVQNRRPKF